MDVIKNGTRGDAVKQVQQDLAALGYGVQPDGIFGDATEKAVRQLQKAFGYNTDGLVGDATRALIAQQKSLNWNARTAASAPAAQPAKDVSQAAPANAKVAK